MKKGISLITLVITIVVVIILAAVVILSIGNNNPINSARVAVVAQTRDSINSAVSAYVAKLKVETMGEYAANEMLFGSLDATQKYKVIDNITSVIEVNGTSKVLYRIDKNVASSKLGIELKKIDNNSNWYLDEYGKVYLIYDTKEVVAKYLKEDDEILSSVSTYVSYAKTISEGPLLIYTITFEANGGTLGNSSIEVMQGEKLNTPIPIKLGYDFLGWYKDIELTEILEEEYYPTSDMTLYANWTISTNTPYKVVHKLMDLDGETYTNYETEELTGETGKEITPAVKTYPGFTSPIEITTVILAEGTTEVVYKYTRNQYTYTLITGTGTVTTGSTGSGTYYYGANIVLNCTASSGYQNARWTSSDTSLVVNPTGLSTTITMPAGNLTMTSSATLISYTISYNLDGGSATNPESYDANSNFTLSNPTRSGYTFTGWTGSNGSTPQTSVTINGSTMTGNKSYTANWDEVIVFTPRNWKYSAYSGHSSYVSNSGKTVTFYTYSNHYACTGGCFYGAEIPSGAKIYYEITITGTGNNSAVLKCGGTQIDSTTSSKSGSYTASSGGILIVDCSTEKRTTDDTSTTTTVVIKKIVVGGKEVPIQLDLSGYYEMHP